MKQSQLLPLVRSRLQAMLNGYIQHPALAEEIDRYVVPPGLGDRAGICGALALAERAYSA